MNIVLGILFSCIFLYINFLIIKTDIEENRIPNQYLKYLSSLIPIIWGYAYIYHYIEYDSLFIFVFQTLGVVIITFFLAHFQFWGAGDAKYFILLFFFLPHTNIIVFVGNISLIIFGYILSTYAYFYSLHLIKKRTGLRENIQKEIKDIFRNYLYNASSPQKILSSLLIFILIFISIRTYKVFAVDYIIQNYTHPYFIGGLICVGALVVTLYALYKRYAHKMRYIYNILIFSLSYIFIIFFIFEYTQDKEKILSLLYKILTLYLLLYFIIKMIKYSVHIYLGQECYLKNISNLEIYDIVERKDFNRKVLPLIENNNKILKYYNLSGYGNIIITQEIKENLTAFIRSINKNNKKVYGGNSMINNIKCIRTFAFAPYLFFGYIISWGFQEKIIHFIYTFIVSSFL